MGIGLGLGIGLGRRRKAAVPFAVSQLFAAGQLGTHAESYDPGSLVERRNLLLWSEDVSNPAWGTNAGATKSGNTINLTEDTASRVLQSGTYGFGAFTFMVKFASDDVGKPVRLSAWAPGHDGLANVGVNITVPPGGVVTRTFPSLNGATVFGIVAASDAVARTMNVVFAMVSRGSALAEADYQKITDWNTEYIAAALPRIAEWQDAPGTTALWAMEQSLGLWQDTKVGIVRGPELFNDQAPTVNNTVGGAVYTYDAATRSITVTEVGSSSSYPRFTYGVGATVGNWYEVIGRVDGDRELIGVNAISFAAGSTSIIGYNQATGIFRGIVQAAGPGVTFQRRGNTLGTCRVAELSVREIPGNHLTQSTGNSRPVASARYNQFVGTEVLATQNVTTLATDYVLSFSGAGSVTLSGTATGSYSAGTHTVTCTAGTLTATVSGAVTKADIRTAADAALLIPPYQGVRTASDYDTVGFPKFAKYDGADDHHVAATGGGATTGFLFVAPICPLTGAGTTRNLWADNGTNTGYRVRLNASNQLEFSAGNGTAFSTIASAEAIPITATRIVAVRDNGVTLRVQVDNGPVVSVARPAVAAGTPGYNVGRVNGAAGSFFGGRMHAFTHRTTDCTDAELVELKKHHAALAGYKLV